MKVLFVPLRVLRGSSSVSSCPFVSFVDQAAVKNSAFVSFVDQGTDAFPPLTGVTPSTILLKINRASVYKRHPAMARTVNKEEHTAKRNDILDAAQRLVYTKG